MMARKQRIDYLRSVEVKLKMGKIQTGKALSKIAEQEPVDLDLYYHVRSEFENINLVLIYCQQEMGREREKSKS